MSEPDAAFVEDKPPRVQAIWILPIVVLVVGIWVVAQSYLNQGPEITISFKTAEGLQAEKTQIKALSVEVGIVESVRLADDLNHVEVKARLNPGTRDLLREDTQIWVERPRIGAGGVSGLGTLLSGAYIELSPGTGAIGKRDFVGLEQVPATPPGVSGLRFTLESDRANSISNGDPILYRGFQVGQIESVKLDLESTKMQYSGFIDAPYDELVTEGSRFWNASGIQIEADASGVNVHTDSLIALIAGGVTFDVPEGHEAGGRVSKGASFKLYASKRDAQRDPYQFGKQFVLLFDQSLRGLEPGAPVEYRGIRIGTVERIMLRELQARDDEAAELPVLIRIEPGRFHGEDTIEGVERLNESMHGAVANGLRAKLETGNLLTGSLFIELDLFPDSEPQSIGEYNGYPMLPTLPGGLDRIEHQVSELLAKLNALPVEQTVAELNAALDTARDLLASVDAMAESDSMQALPARLEAALLEIENAAASFAEGSEFYSDADVTLDELTQTLQSIRALAESIEEKPNSLIFSGKHEPDPEPGRGSQ